MGLWVQIQNALRTELPQNVQDTLDKHEKDGTTASDDYQAAMRIFYSQFLCRMDPWPKELDEYLAWIDKDSTVYFTMRALVKSSTNGPSEFYITGPLKDWSIIDEAHKVAVSTLLFNGRYDEARVPAVEPFFREVPHIKWFTFAESSHLSHFEKHERFMEIVARVLLGGPFIYDKR
ncbi:hypothetical protein GGX14DRAFT_383014 [Mycena pura]|uniref:Proline iminopeptidase n=1 Tax=Mycena pura TaxID=153505 RepID=A0AAD6XXK6_9AGAR|nr:hypothetical protein GGX14DRAFT_383014 [Mycena pura]